MSGDPLAAPSGSRWAWGVNVLFQLDCLIACLLTGARNKTLSCWLGECADGRFGKAWKWGLCWVWWPVDGVALHVFGQARHCESSVGPFLIEEDVP